jgi:hypothetical protein
MDGRQPASACTCQGAIALLCALLMLIVGFAQANHVHSDKSGSDNHECSVCAVAHAGALMSTTYQPIQVFARSVLAECPEASPHSLLLTFFRYIRPPPSV